MSPGPLREVAWLSEQLGAAELRVVDCRFRLGEPGAGERLWREGHIPGAGFLDVDRDLAAEPGEGGRHPLPAAEAFQAAARRAGITARSTVIAYDEAGEGGAARLWWLLRHFGHADVAVLDGGLRAWRAQGGALEAAGPTEAGTAAPGDERPQPPGPDPFIARSRSHDTASPEELTTRHPSTLLLDARAPERFRGEVEPVDTVAGHIPGAVNLPFAELAPQGRFADVRKLEERFRDAGAREAQSVVAYCGSGVTACVLLLAAEAAGLHGVRLYPGSWSEWSRRGYPAARHESARTTDRRSNGPGGLRSA